MITVIETAAPIRSDLNNDLRFFILPLANSLRFLTIYFFEFGVIDCRGWASEHQLAFVERDDTVGIAMHQIEKMQAAKDGNSIFLVDFFQVLHNGVSQDRI